MLTLVLATMSAHASDVSIDVQARILDALGVPVNNPVNLTVSLCPNQAVTEGEDCYSELFANTTIDDGYISVSLGASGGLDHTVFEAEDLYVAYDIGGGELPTRTRVGHVRPRPLGLSATIPLGPAKSAYPEPTTGTVVLFLTFENGFTDSGPFQHTVEREGNARIDPDAAAGQGSVRFGDPGPSWLRIPPSPAFGVASNEDFTIEYWAKYEPTESGQSDQRVFQFGANVTDGFRLAHKGTGSNVNLGSNTTAVNGVPINSLYGTGWHHFAWSREGSTLRVFLDGQLATSTTYTVTNNAAYGMYFATYPGSVGAASAYWMNGRLDDFRFVVGEALYTEDFTLPSVVQSALVIENGVITGYQGQ